ncbi:MAG: PHP domain-containing protein [Streptosporangiales bacterium]|nr:PHP domain-containing protein [Streptosporangiales bacterium]
MRIDLHSHSDASDGTEPPAEVVRRARAAGLDILALTDHDTVAGHREAAAALPPGLTLVPGVELSCLDEGSSVHLLGYLFDPDEPELAAELERIRGDRARRGREMVDRLVRLGVPVSWAQVQRIAGRAAVGRPHIAQAMVEAGAVPGVADAFTTEWIAAGGRAYVGRYGPAPDRAIRLVRRAGGVTVLAHPYAERGHVLGDDVLARLAEAGLDGVEVDHPDHEPADRTRLRGLARELGLVPTGCSDDHGALTGHRLGCDTTAVQAYEVLVARADGAPLRHGEDDAT